MRVITTLVIITLLAACASNTKLDLNIPANAKIGIVNLLDENPHHSHSGTTVFTNNKKTIEADWEIHQIEEYTLSQLEVYKDNSVKIIEPTPELLAARYELLNESWGAKLDKKYEADMKKVRDDHEINYLIVIRPYGDSSYPSTVISFGYGVYTDCFFGICRADALANVDALLFELSDSINYLGHGVKLKPYHITRVDIDLKKGVENFTVDDYENARDPVNQLIKERIDSLISRSGLREQI